MSTTYTYDVVVTDNGMVNPAILAKEVEDLALASGGAFEGIEVLGGVMQSGSQIVGGTIEITWQNALDPGDESAQATAVADHLGTAFGSSTQMVESRGTDSTGLDTPQDKINVAAEPLPAGTYLVTSSCEIRMQSVVAGASVQADASFGGTTVGSDSWSDDTWHEFSASAQVVVDAGEVPAFLLTYQRVGNPATVEIRQATMIAKLAGP